MTVYHLDPAKGSDDNDGSSFLPWQSISRAVAGAAPGDTVILAQGLYRVAPGGQWGIALQHFGPERVTFKANGRAVLTSTKGNPVDVTLADGVVLDGLWLGGLPDWGMVKGIYGPIDHCISFGAAGAQGIGTGMQLIHCTLWGYHSAVISGSSEYALVQGNRLVNCGGDGLWHGIYVSGDDKKATGGASTHWIIDRNTLLGGEGYGIHGWHFVNNLVYSRNFVASHNWGAVLDGSSHLLANNCFWKLNGAAQSDPWGAWIDCLDSVIANNIFGPHGWARVPNPGANAYHNNAYSWDIPRDPTYQPHGDGIVMLKAGNEQAELGVSELVLDAAIATLKASFSRSVEEVYADSTIQHNFALLDLHIPATGPLYRAGYPLFGPDHPLNIGPDAATPEQPAQVWQMFKTLGLKEWDRWGRVIG